MCVMTLGHIDPFLSIITCEQNLNSSFLRRTFAQCGFGTQNPDA